MNKEYFAMRVSTQGIRGNGAEQTFDRQVYIFEKAGYKLTEENTFADHITGGSKLEQRPNFNKLLDILQEGDTVHFVDVSRFSRDYINGMEMIDTLLYDKKVDIVFVGDNKRLYANKRFDPSEWFYISMMLLTAEYQKRCIGHATFKGIQAKKEKDPNFKIGRPKQIEDDLKEDVIKYYNDGNTMQKTADYFGISKSSVCRMIKGEI